VRQCANSAHCAICSARGLPASHRSGAELCPPLPPSWGGRRKRGPASYADVVRGGRGSPRKTGLNGLDPPSLDKGREGKGDGAEAHSPVMVGNGPQRRAVHMGDGEAHALLRAFELLVGAVTKCRLQWGDSGARALLRANEPVEVASKPTSNRGMPAGGNREGTDKSPSPSKIAGKKRRKAEPIRGKPEAALVR